MKNILVSGAGEFIGGHLLKRLIEDGFQLVAKFFHLINSTICNRFIYFPRY